MDIRLDTSNGPVDTHRSRDSPGISCRDAQTQVDCLLMESDVHSKWSRDPVGKLPYKDDCGTFMGGMVE